MKHIFRFLTVVAVVGGIGVVGLDVGREEVHSFQYRMTEKAFGFADELGITDLVHKVKEYMNQF